MPSRPRHSFRRYFYFVFLILLVLACKRSSHYSSGPSYSSSNPSPSPQLSSARNLPDGFRSIPPSSGTGNLLYGGMSGSSAKGAVFGALKALTSNFDSSPHVLAAMVTANDDEAQALIDGVRDGQPIRGIAYAETTPSQCLVTVVYDLADEFARSSADLVRLAQQTLPAPSATPVPLQHMTLSDGTTLDLPGGWTVQPDNGAVGGTGPEGTFEFGRAMEVYTPEAADYYEHLPYGVRPPLVAAYGDPGRELQELWVQLKLANSPDDIQIIERASLPWWTSGPAEILHLQGVINGSQSEWLGQVLTSPSGAGKWMYYYSGVATSPSTFNQNLPTLMRIWLSWKTDDRVYTERLMNAARSLQQCGRIIQEANAYRQNAMERSSIAWDHIVRGTWPIEDQQTHSRLIPQQDVSVVVRKLNESEGYDRWRVVPYEELNR